MKSEFIYTPELGILYALGIGESKELKYLYECCDQFTIIPSICVLPGIKALIDYDTHQNALAKIKIPFDISRLLHGEQYLELFKPIQNLEQKIITDEPHIVEVLDKSSATIVITETNTRSQDGTLLFRNQTNCVIVGAGGWNGPRQSGNEQIVNIIKPPEREPDHVIEEETHINQAALYRLSGDKNPLHIDPIFATAGGYTRPIMHGLCSFGFATRHLLKTYPNKQLRSIKGRFSNVIYPGETILTDIWEGDKGLVHFQSRVKESGKTIILGGFATFF